MTEEFKQRKSDKWIAPFIAFWDFIDNRQIDKHFVSVAILWGTVKVTEWAMVFAGTHGDPKDAVGTAAIIAAVLIPYNALQAAAINFYFKARQ